MPASLPTALLLSVLAAGPAAAQAPVPDRSVPLDDVRYDVTFTASQALQRTVDVTMSFATRRPGPVVLSLPAWTPGAYEISDYARNVSGFTATADGRPARWRKVDPDSWRLDAAGARRLEVRFRVRADSLDTAFPWAAEDVLVFVGTALFPYPEGIPADWPATVRISTEPGWRVATSMLASDGGWRAASYHELVDQPFIVGRFDLDSAQVAGRWMRLATYPAGRVAAGRRERLWRQLRQVVPPAAAVFGEVPWRSYTVVQVADSGVQGMSALEHAEAEVAHVGTPYLDEPFVPAVHAHELLHAWNVKRMRPAELWPYRYDRAQPTPWLWVSEGITDYYADLVQVRGGVLSPDEFLAGTQAKLDHVRAAGAVSVADASLQAWLRMRDGTADLYYDKGSVLGLAMDLLIRDATDNRASLDDVMRTVYAGSWGRARGFIAADWWGAARRAAPGVDWDDFARRYVEGRDSPPWDRWLALAGWRVRADSATTMRVIQPGEPPRPVTMIDERLIEDPAAPPRARRVRQGILEGRHGRG